jgi:type I restriction enzyme, S subunit
VRIKTIPLWPNLIHNFPLIQVQTPYFSNDYGGRIEMINDKIDSLPHGWAFSTLADISLPITKVNRAYEKPSEYFSYIDIEAIDNKRNVVKDTKAYLWANAPSRAQQKVNEDDILFSNVRPYLKNIAMVPSVLDNQIASSGFCVIRPLIIVPKYVFYYVLSQSFVNSINALAKGTSYPAVTDGMIYKQSIPIAPLEEQQRIVDKIDELFSKLEQSEQMLTRSLRRLKVYRFALLKSAFEGKLTSHWRNNISPPNAAYLIEEIEQKREALFQEELAQWQKSKRKTKKPVRFYPTTNVDSDFIKIGKVPTSWAWGNVGQLAYSFKNGIYKPSEFYKKNGIACLRMYNISVDGKILWYDIKRIKLTKKELEEYELYEDDILINRVNSREIVGKAARINGTLEQCIFESKNVRLRLIEKSTSRYVNYWFLLAANQYFSKNAQQTAGMASINQEQIGNLPIPIASILEQEKIVDEIESRFTLCDNLEETISASIEKINSFKSSILTKAFRGELTSQDDANENAADLLKQVKLEKSKYLLTYSTIKKLKRTKKPVMRNNKDILEILKEAQSPMLASEVWQLSKFNEDIEQFYTELKNVELKVNVTVIGLESYLSLTNEN